MTYKDIEERRAWARKRYANMMIYARTFKKECAKCRLTLVSDMFYKRKNRKSGFSSYLW